MGKTLGGTIGLWEADLPRAEKEQAQKAAVTRERNRVAKHG